MLNVWSMCEDWLYVVVRDEEMERQVEEQVGKRRELEITLKLLEKDAWAKQATVGALRKQLEDIKMISQDISNKVRVTVLSLLTVRMSFICVGWPL